jgi:acyl-homoserine lactone acylase PvdQ
VLLSVALSLISRTLFRQADPMKRIAPLCALLVSLSLLNFPPRAALAQATAAAPQTKTITLAALRAPARVARDERGVPHVEAANDEDLYFAQGYATAQDRLWQMDLLRRTARGELSEIFGKATLDSDKLHRTYGFARLAEGLEAKASPKTRAALDSYARGVNAYAESLDQKSLPREFQILGYRPRPWRPADSIVIGKIFAESLSVSYGVDLGRAAIADLAPERRAQLLAESSPLDVLVVGTDEVDKRPANARPANNDRKKPAGRAGDERKKIARTSRPGAGGGGPARAALRRAPPARAPNSCPKRRNSTESSASRSSASASSWRARRSVTTGSSAAGARCRASPCSRTIRTSTRAPPRSGTWFT